MVKRILVEKKDSFRVEADKLKEELVESLLIKNLEDVRIIHIYDVDNMNEADLELAKKYVFADLSVDNILKELPCADYSFMIEPLPGQFDMRSNSAILCIQLISPSSNPLIRSKTCYLFNGKITNDDKNKIKNYLVNSVETRICTPDIPTTLSEEIPEIKDEIILDNFINFNNNQLTSLIDDMSLSMDIDDLKMCQDYFSGEKRDPTLTEIKVIDTYWSDHCRHTTFNTILKEIEIQDEAVNSSFGRYLDLKKEIGREDKPTTLMDIGTIAAKVLKKKGLCKQIDESDEINACTIKAKVDVNGELEDWYYLFKNETHNHPTEIEPFGGAATCIGGAIRDPLSGRSYVYQSMRITGSGDPRVPVQDTLPNKLPTRKICRGAAQGYSSYGNQIGIATGLVDEIYHPGYVAKRAEIGAVVGAVPAKSVVRQKPDEGDVVVLIGGRTGRDGIGGATGSSKSHGNKSLSSCSAEVQKGNAPEEHKLQRFFRHEEVSKMIKRCNDFGAGGVSVAVGELADGISINLNSIKKKYEGLNGLELSISESQERMACVIEKKNLDKFLKLADEENLEATQIATITKEIKLVEYFNDKKIVDLKRDFLNTNGAKKENNVFVEKFEKCDKEIINNNFESILIEKMSDINSCAKIGLNEMFDSSIGASSVSLPYSGKYYLTPAISMIAKLPVLGETNTISGMSWGYDPYLTEHNHYLGAMCAVVDSICKLVCSGFSRKDIYLSFQEYFKKMGTDPKNWGQPFSCLLGALDAQIGLEVAAIGGKDSMSGTFNELSVPPTLVSFATALSDANIVITPDIKNIGSKIIAIYPRIENDIYDFDYMTKYLDSIYELIVSGKVLSANCSSKNGLIESLFKMCLGNKIGLKFDNVEISQLFEKLYGSIVLEVKEENCEEVLQYLKDNSIKSAMVIAQTISDYKFFINDENIDLKKVENSWVSALDDIYPRKVAKKPTLISKIESNIKGKSHSFAILDNAKPKVVIPVFPGTNCEYDSKRVWEEVGANTEIVIIKNLNQEKIIESIDRLSYALKSSQILFIPGGFSGGDEPEGSAKLIASFLRNNQISEEISNLIDKRDGLILGICNGFQALIKLGLLPYGKIREQSKDSPTLTFNTIGRHQAKMVNVISTSTLSPWYSKIKLGEVHNIPISHGEGRFVCNDNLLNQMINKGQVCSQYCDINGEVKDDIRINPNGSILNIEAICSQDGKILGKMGHSERRGNNLYKGIPGNHFQEIFEGGISYFKY